MSIWLCLFVVCLWFVCTVSGLFFQGFICLNDQAHFAWFTSGVARGQLGDKTGPLKEDDLWRKTTFDGRQPLTEDDLWQKTIFDGRLPLTKDDLWRKMTIDGRQPLTENDLWRKTTYDGRWPLMEDDLWRRWPLKEDDLWQKTTYDGRQPSTENNLRRKTTFGGKPPLAHTPHHIPLCSIFFGSNIFLDPNVFGQNFFCTKMFLK